ncbi:MAG: hypothetical protein ACRDNK_05635 [Solirubrobacteraceae bacterium]
MSTGQAGDPTGAGGSATEEELRAAYEAEIKKIRVEQVLLEQVVSLINLGMRRTGLSQGTEDERDLGQVRLAIDSIRALMPLVERSAAAQAGPIRDALSQLQLAYVRLGGTAEGGESIPGAAPAAASEGAAPSPDAPSRPAPGPAEGQPTPSSGDLDPAHPSAHPAAHPSAQPVGKPGESEEPGPAQRSGRLWVPGQ